MREKREKWGELESERRTEKKEFTASDLSRSYSGAKKRGEERK